MVLVYINMPNIAGSTYLKSETVRELQRLPVGSGRGGGRWGRGGGEVSVNLPIFEGGMRAYIWDG